MKTRKIFRCLLAALFAVNVTGDVVAQTTASIQFNTGNTYFYNGKNADYKTLSSTTNTANDWSVVSNSKGTTKSIDTNSDEDSKPSWSKNNNYTVFAQFSAKEINAYRVIAQNIQTTITLPKYTSCNLLFAGNVEIAGKGYTEKKRNKYGFEMVDFAQQSQNTTSVNWNTNSSSEKTSSLNNNFHPNQYNPVGTLLRNGSDGYTKYVGSKYEVKFGTGSNSESTTISRNYGLMAYLRQNDLGISATATFGYQVAYTYYATIKYDKNGKDCYNYLSDQSGSAVGENGSFKISNTICSRQGYTFKGWATSKMRADAGTVDYLPGAAFYPYDSVKGGGKGNVTLYAVWEGKEYTVTFYINGGKWLDDSSSNKQVKARYGQKMPEVDFMPNAKNGNSVFNGFWYNGTQYYDAQMNSLATWNFPQDVTISAQWYTITNTKLKFTNKDQDGKVVDEYLIEDNRFQSSKYNSLVGKVDKDKKPIVATPREGFIFEGWECQAGGSVYLVYDGEGNAVEGRYWVKDSKGNLIWNKTDTQTDLTARWLEASEVATVSIQLIRQNNYEGDNNVHTYVGATVGGLMSIADFKGDGYITVDGKNYLSCEAVKSGNDVKENLLSVDLEHAPIWHFEKTTDRYNRPTYNIFTVTESGDTLYLGNRVSNMNEIMDAGIGIQRFEPEAKFTIYDAGEGKGWVCFDEEILGEFNHVLYMQENLDHHWEFENSHHNAQYKGIRLLAAGRVISDMNTETIIKTIKEELASPGDDGSYPYAYNYGSKPTVNDKDLCNGVLYVDLSTIAGFEEVNKTDLVNFQKETSPNCVFFMPNGANVRSDNTRILVKNVAHKLSSNYEAVADLTIKDKMPFSSPYTFHLGNYTASYTRENANKWSSLFLPFQVKANDNIKFYELYGSDEVRLAYQSIGENAVPANKPIACFGSGTFTLTNTNVEVMKDPVDLSKGPYSEELFAFTSEDIREFAENFGSAKPEAGSEDCEAWQLVGTRFARYIYGTENAGAMPAGSNVEKRNVYYFSGGNFTYVNPKGRVLFAPFRAYYQLGANSSIKTFSIIAFDENDGATDITDVMTGNDSEGDGKIYDLMGRRVKMPLKGHVYVVNGKKKLY